jgi:hypothetical protein
MYIVTAFVMILILAVSNLLIFVLKAACSSVCWCCVQSGGVRGSVGACSCPSQIT